MELLWTISEFRSPLGDKLVQFVTYFGEQLFLLSIICLLYWCLNKKLATQIGLTFVTSGMLVQGLKITFRIPRPWVLDPDFKAVESAIEAATGYSFPSGHTQSATSLFAPLAYHAKKYWLKIAFTLCFLAVGFSRMYLGVHTLKDVGVAILLTCAISFVIHKYQDVLIDNKQNTKKICIVLFIAAIFLMIYSPLLNKLGYIEAHYIGDCYKITGAALGLALGWYLERTRLNFSPTDGTVKERALRFAVGMLLTAVFYVLPKLVFSSIALWKMIRYAFIIFWIIYLYPYLFVKYKK